MNVHEVTMTQKIKKRIPIKNEFLTKEKLVPMFEDIKDLIISTAKATEAVVRKEIHEVKKDVEHLKNDVGHVQVAVTEHTKMIKQLQNDVQSVRTDVQSVRTELKDEMHQMETRLTEKIDKHVVRMDDFESRISTIETSR